MNIKQALLKIDIIRKLAEKFSLSKQSKRFRGSKNYWVERYRAGGNSGEGSYGAYARFKARVINEFIRRYNISSVIEFGCGDGNQLRLLEVPGYIGFDVSPEALARCREFFESDETKSFALMEEYSGQKADLTMSLDVIYHLVEDEVYERYMRRLFGAADDYVLIYSSNTNKQKAAQYPHVRRRQFSRWIEENAPEWSLMERVPNEILSFLEAEPDERIDFSIYRRKAES